MKPLRLCLRLPLRVRLRGRAAVASLLFAALAASSVGCGASASVPLATAAMAPPADASSPETPVVASPSSVAADLAAKTSDGPAKETPATPQGRAAPAPNAASAPTSAKITSEATAEAPLIVYQGDVTLRVEAGSGPGAVDTIVAMAEALGGHLAGRDEGRVTVKIPSRRFREAMSQIEGAFEVERRNVKADDVTAEFKDLEVRLENLRATRKRIEELMQKSGTLEGTLSVERELERVAAEIDRIQGRLRFLRTHTSFSTLTANVVEKPKAAPIVATKTPPATKRDLALPLGWLDRVGVETLVAVPADD